jgi:hypothetical protein
LIIFAKTRATNKKIENINTNKTFVGQQTLNSMTTDIYANLSIDARRKENIQPGKLIVPELIEKKLERYILSQTKIQEIITDFVCTQVECIVHDVNYNSIVRSLHLTYKNISLSMIWNKICLVAPHPRYSKKENVDSTTLECPSRLNGDMHPSPMQGYRRQPQASHNLDKDIV